MAFATEYIRRPKTCRRVRRIVGEADYGSEENSNQIRVQKSSGEEGTGKGGREESAREEGCCREGTREEGRCEEGCCEESTRQEEVRRLITKGGWRLR